MDRSSGSVMDNIAEGFDTYTKADFRHFLVIARGSNAAFRSQLYRAAKRGIIDKQLLQELKTEAEQLGVKLHHFISYLTSAECKHKSDDPTWHPKPHTLQEPELEYSNFSNPNYPESFTSTTT